LFLKLCSCLKRCCTSSEPETILPGTKVQGTEHLSRSSSHFFTYSGLFRDAETQVLTLRTSRLLECYCDCVTILLRPENRQSSIKNINKFATMLPRLVPSRPVQVSTTLIRCIIHLPHSCCFCPILRSYSGEFQARWMMYVCVQVDQSRYRAKKRSASHWNETNTLVPCIPSPSTMFTLSQTEGFVEDILILDVTCVHMQCQYINHIHIHT
jgi:hypothetical protein